MEIASFDKAASSYDSEFTFGKIGRLQRSRVWSYLNNFIKDNDVSTVLELNCGTGEDAKYISELGCKVVATDISKDMLAVAAKKNEHTSAVFTELDLNAPELEFDEKFDLVFSNFGGLNCIDKGGLSNLNNWLSEKLKPGGSLILVLMPSKTLIDRWYNIAKGRRTVIKERSSNKKLNVNVSGQLVTTYYYDKKDIIDSFDKFSHVATQSVGFVPSFLESNRALKFLLILDKLFYWSKLNATKADHYLIHLSKII